MGRHQAPEDGDFVAYVGIGGHGVVGDRRTAALVAADGNVDWLCAPGYFGAPLFGAMLDAARGGHFRFGPARLLLGRQRYVEDSAILLTRWSTGRFELELCDVMLWPEDRRAQGGDAHVLVRRLRCLGGEVDCALSLRPRRGFDDDVRFDDDGTFALPAIGDCRLWSSRPLAARGDGARAGRHRLRDGESWWTVLALGDTRDWSEQRAAAAVDETELTWRGWIDRIRYDGPRARHVRRTAVTIHLLSNAGDGSVVAAPTTSLPERLGGAWNADYRLAWVRDASLSMAMLARLGDDCSAARLLDWLAGLPAGRKAPLRVAYAPDGTTTPRQHDRKDLHGYRGSRPVRFGNHAYRQRQLDSLGFLLDCAWSHLERGGRFGPREWRLVVRAAEWTAQHWGDKGNGIWELPVEQHYLSGRVMSWVALARAAALAERLGRPDEARRWNRVAAQVHADVLTRGWSERLGAFRQRYEAENLDAAALLVPVMGLLPPEDPRVRATVARIDEALTINGFAYRFRPREVPGLEPLPLGEYEAAFLPCTFWLAAAQAMIGRVDAAEALLERAEGVAGELGLFAEAVDPRDGLFAGNMPLLFSHVEYVRAVLELGRRLEAGRARPREREADLVRAEARPDGY